MHNLLQRLPSVVYYVVITKKSLLSIAYHACGVRARGAPAVRKPVKTHGKPLHMRRPLMTNANPYAQADTPTLCPFYLPNALTPLLTLSTPRPLLPELLARCPSMSKA